MNLSLLFTVVGLIVVLWATVYLILKTSIIKDTSVGDLPTYSLGKTQLLWWTIIIVSCFIVAAGANEWESLPVINTTVLTLLGISLGTTASSKIAGNSFNTNSLRQHNSTSKGFFKDLLSDENGTSIHRFQTVAFNIIFGITYFVNFIQNECVFIEYSTEQLALLGISSAGYIALKANEKGEKHTNVPPTTPAN